MARAWLRRNNFVENQTSGGRRRRRGGVGGARPIFGTYFSGLAQILETAERRSHAPTGTVRKKVLGQGFQEAAAGVPYVTHHRRLGCVLRLVLFAYYGVRVYLRIISLPTQV